VRFSSTSMNLMGRAFSHAGGGCTAVPAGVIDLRSCLSSEPTAFQLIGPSSPFRVHSVSCDLALVLRCDLDDPRVWKSYNLEVDVVHVQLKP